MSILRHLWAKYKTLLFRIFREVWLPLLCGAVWAVIAFHNGKSAFDSFSTFGATFFFVFFLQGQVLRISKNLRDETNANEFKDSFASIHQALDEIRKQRAAEPRPRGRRRTTDSTITKWVTPEKATFDRAKYYFDEAASAIDNGFLYPAVLVAATGFENVLRETGKQFSLDARKPVRLIIQEIGARLDNADLTKQLLLLLRLRNTLVHEQDSSRPKNVDEAQSIVGAFEDGICKLDATTRGYLGR
jgi:hypothetical protein